MAREIKEGQVYVVDGGAYNNCLCVVVSKDYDAYVGVRLLEQGAVQTKSISTGSTGSSLSLYAWRLNKFLGWLEDKENT